MNSCIIHYHRRLSSVVRSQQQEGLVQGSVNQVDGKDPTVAAPSSPPAPTFPPHHPNCRVFKSPASLLRTLRACRVDGWAMVGAAPPPPPRNRAHALATENTGLLARPRFACLCASVAGRPVRRGLKIVQRSRPSECMLGCLPRGSLVCSVQCTSFVVYLAALVSRCLHLSLLNRPPFTPEASWPVRHQTPNGILHILSTFIIIEVMIHFAFKAIKILILNTVDGCCPLFL